MSSFGKKILSIILSLTMSLGLISIYGNSVTVSSASAGQSEYKVGDIIEYGAYPQSDVTNSLGSVLDSQIGTWKSYGYYSGSDIYFDGQMAPSNYMYYKDVTYNGEKYRGVMFDKYKKYHIGYHYGKIEEDNSYQDDNGYYCNNVYWFKYEPIKWRVLDPLSGFVICDSIIDCQPINSYIFKNGKTGSGEAAYWGDIDKTYYVSNYSKSLMRQWLNSTFFNTAFSSEQKENIKLTGLNNDCVKISGVEREYEEFNAPHTEDKIFLLSFDEVKNGDYKLDLKSRQLQGTDYAKCEGLAVDSKSGNSDWWLRTPCFSSHIMCLVTSRGYVCGTGEKELNGYSATLNIVGVCPAMKLNTIKNDISSGVLEEYEVTWKANGVDTVQTVSIGYPLVKPANPFKEGYTFKGWTPEVPVTMPKCNLTFMAVFEKINPTALSKLFVPSNTEVKYASTVTVKAKATDVPEGYYVALYDGKTLLKKGSNNEVSYTFPNEFTSTKNLTVKIIDNEENVQKDGNGNDLSASFEVKAKSGFFAKLIAFFKRLFKTLPKVTIEPK